MSTIRGYLAPFFAGCVMLATGIALGGGPLQRADGGQDASGLIEENQTLRDQVVSARDSGRYDDAWGRALAPQQLAGRLQGAAVTIVALPGVEPSAVGRTRSTIDDAGGSVAVVVTVAGEVLDPAKKTYVDSVADGALTGADGLPAPPADDTYRRFGAVLARAYVGSSDEPAGAGDTDTGTTDTGDASTRPTGIEYDETAAGIDAELQGARLVELAAPPQRRGTLVVVLGSGVHGTDAVTQAAQVIAVDLITALAAAGDALVVTTPPPGRMPGGVLDRVADDERVATLPVSTTNAGSTANGLVTTVFGLATALAGDPGDYGIVAGEPVLPPGVAAAGT